MGSCAKPGVMISTRSESGITSAGSQLIFCKHVHTPTRERVCVCVSVWVWEAHTHTHTLSLSLSHTHTHGDLVNCVQATHQKYLWYTLVCAVVCVDSDTCRRLTRLAELACFLLEGKIHVHVCSLVAEHADGNVRSVASAAHRHLNTCTSTRWKIGVCVCLFVCVFVMLHSAPTKSSDSLMPLTTSFLPESVMVLVGCLLACLMVWMWWEKYSCHTAHNSESDCVLLLSHKCKG